MQCSNDWSIDSKSKLSCYGRYCNDPILPTLLNAELRGSDTDGDKDGVIGHVESTRDIQAGDEIYVSYGIGYWCQPANSRLLRADETNYLMRNSAQFRKYFYKSHIMDLTDDID